MGRVLEYQITETFDNCRHFCQSIARCNFFTRNSKNGFCYALEDANSTFSNTDWQSSTRVCDMFEFETDMELRKSIFHTADYENVFSFNHRNPARARLCVPTNDDKALVCGMESADEISSHDFQKYPPDNCVVEKVEVSWPDLIDNYLESEGNPNFLAEAFFINKLEDCIAICMPLEDCIGVQFTKATTACIALAFNPRNRATLKVTSAGRDTLWFRYCNVQSLEHKDHLLPAYSNNPFYDGKAIGCNMRVPRSCFAIHASEMMALPSKNGFCKSEPKTNQIGSFCSDAGIQEHDHTQICMYCVAGKNSRTALGVLALESPTCRIQCQPNGNHVCTC